MFKRQCVLGLYTLAHISLLDLNSLILHFVVSLFDCQRFLTKCIQVNQIVFTRAYGGGILFARVLIMVVKVQPLIKGCNSRVIVLFHRFQQTITNTQQTINMLILRQGDYNEKSAGIFKASNTSCKGDRRN